MSLGSFYKGTSLEQDGRFKNKNKLLLDNIKFPKEFDEKVDISKVELKVINGWIERRVTEILGFEDEFLVNYTMSLLEGDKSKDNLLDPKHIQIQLMSNFRFNFNFLGFLDNNTPVFVKELWNLLLSAQKSENGIVFLYNDCSLLS